jgi:DNA-binding response OmpR family regulator
MAKVLVVEDEPSAVAIVKYHLESAGFDGVYAEDAEEGWRMLVSEAPDALVTDTNLPGGDGWSFIDRVRHDGRFDGLPIVVLTDPPEQDAADRATGFDCEHLAKPFAATVLLNKLRSIIKQSDRRGPRMATPPRRTDPRRVKLVAVGVVIMLDHYRIEGTVHLPPELSRFSDAWETIIRDQRTYFPVNRARVTSPDGTTVYSTPAFIEVRKADVRAVFPQDIPVPGNGRPA